VRRSPTPIAERARNRSQAEPLASPIAARLELISGARAVWIVSLDPYGALLRMDSPPPLGVSALLKWDVHEHFTTVSWTGNGECALKFDRQVPQVAPMPMAARPANQPRAVAALDQMRTRKRRKALVLDHSTGSDTNWEWVVRLGRRNAPIDSADSLTTEEQMFFFRAPLAHLVDRQRAIR
jgi:hypothetical protein